MTLHKPYSIDRGVAHLHFVSMKSATKKLYRSMYAVVTTLFVIIRFKKILKKVMLQHITYTTILL